MELESISVIDIYTTVGGRIVKKLLRAGGYKQYIYMAESVGCATCKNSPLLLAQRGSPRFLRHNASRDRILRNEFKFGSPLGALSSSFALEDSMRFATQDEALPVGEEC